MQSMLGTLLGPRHFHLLTKKPVPLVVTPVPLPQPLRGNTTLSMPMALLSCGPLSSTSNFNSVVSSSIELIH